MIEVENSLLEAKLEGGLEGDRLHGDVRSCGFKGLGRFRKINLDRFRFIFVIFSDRVHEGFLSASQLSLFISFGPL